MKTEDNRFYAIFQHSHVGIIISNREGNIMEINPFGAEIFGYQQDELIGKKIEILLPSRMREGHVGLREGYIKNPEPRTMGVGRDLRALRKDGREIAVEVSLCSYGRRETQKIVSFVNDVTERKKAEDQLKEFNLKLESKVYDRTQELTQALVELGHTNENLKKSEAKVRQALEKERDLNEMKSRFVSMASHEFRTPLAGILTSITLIDKYDAPEQAHKKDKHIKTIRRSVKNLTAILNDFLSLDKLEEGVVGVNPCFFNLREVVRSIVQDTMELSLDNQKVIYKECGANEDIYQDENMIRNILLNLLSNAIKYTPGNKDIFLETNIDDEKIELVVRDQGVGIPQAEQKYLFQRFFRAKNVLNLQGTGLGLNIVKRYLDLINGTISFESFENVGTTFKVVIPKDIKK